MSGQKNGGMGNGALDMTEGKPTGLLLRFLLPMVIGNVFQQLYNLSDSIIVGRFLGPDALAAVGSTNAISFFFFSIAIGLSAGGAAYTSQNFGAGHTERVKATMVNAAYLMLACTAAAGTAGFLAAGPLIRFMGTPDNIMQDALLYMKVGCVGVPAIGLYNYIASMLQALGDSRTPLGFLLLSTGLNIVLDIVFIGPLAMGVFGAAFATIIAQFISGILCSAFAFRHNPYFRFERRHFLPDLQIMRTIFKLGATIALQYSMIAVSTMALQKTVNSFGSDVVAAFAVTSRVEQLAHQPFSALGTAVSTYSGQNCGGRRMDRVRAGWWSGLRIALVFALLLFPLMQLGGHEIVRWFTDDAEVVAFGTRGLKITSWFYAFLGVIYVTRGLLNGAGDVLFAFINGVVEMAGRIAVPKPLTAVPAIHMWGLWLAAGIVWLISSAASIFRYRMWLRRHPAEADGAQCEKSR